MIKKIAILASISFLMITNVNAQAEIIETKRGNEAMADGDLSVAIEHYKKALEVNPSYREAAFNLGNAYQAQSEVLSKEASQIQDEAARQEYVTKIQESSKQAASQFEVADKQAETDQEINDTQYNMGNANLVGGELDKSIEAYKEALRKEPTDEEARYNLAYAQHLKKQQEQEQQDQQDQEQQEQNQDQDQEQQEQEKKEQEQQNQEQQQEQQQSEQQEMSKQEAEQLLEALQKQEKDLQDKLKKKKTGKPVKIEKDW